MFSNNRINLETSNNKTSRENPFLDFKQHVNQRGNHKENLKYC